jgi:PKD repeat protein
MLGAVIAACLAAATTAVGADLNADFSWSPSQPLAGQEITFTSKSTGDPQTFAWDLDGDGQYNDGAGATATRTFTGAGDHKVRLRVTNANGDTDQTEKTVKVSSGIQSSFTWSPQSPTTADPVTFTSTSTATGASFQSYQWDLNGDSRFGDATGATTTFTFPDAGDHQVGLRVTDSSGARSTAFNTVTVAAPPPPPPPAPEPPPAPVGQQWLNPFPSVRIRGRASFGGVHLSLLATRAPVGTTMKVRCIGRRCPKKRDRSYTFTTERLRLKGYERFFTAGTKLELFIWKPGVVGKFTRFTMRRAKAPIRVDRCLYPGGKWPGRCPK